MKKNLQGANLFSSYVNVYESKQADTKVVFLVNNSGESAKCIGHIKTACDTYCLELDIAYVLLAVSSIM